MNYLDQNVGWLARNIPGATRVFHKHDIDFCCGGNQPLGVLLERKGVTPSPVVDELAALERGGDEQQDRWENADSDTLIDHVLDRYHAIHGEQLTELIRLARRVEQVHASHPDCPRGLAEHLTRMLAALESHMMKEEQILFPALRQAASNPAILMPISVMRHEHDEHGEALATIERLTGQMLPPKGACTTWRALYGGLVDFKTDIMQHIHLENNVLFFRIESLLEAS